MNPEEIYLKKISFYTEAVEKQARLDDWCANARLVLFAGMVALGWWLYEGEASDLLPVGGLLVAFFCLAGYHSVVLDRLLRLKTAHGHFQRSLNRIRGQWAGKGTTSRHLEPSNHLFSRDLDLFGEGSLFDLLDTTVSAEGQEQLACWLLEGSSAVEILERQAAVAELSSAVDDRETIAQHCATESTQPNRATLGGWAKGACEGDAAALKQMTIAVGVLTPFLMVLTIAQVLPNFAYLFWPIGAWSLYRYSKAFREAAHRDLRTIELDLGALQALLALARKHKASSALLVAIEEDLFEGDKSAQRLLERLDFLVSLKDTQKNQFFAPIAFLLFWDPIFVLLVEQWRREHGKELTKWVEAAAKRDALMALATFHFENPDYCVPDIVEQAVGQKPVWQGIDVAHPFLEREGRIANDLGLGQEPAVLMLSGSNMSGKSTLLRSVGVNTVLAQAGTVVCAKKLTLSPVLLGATLRVHDSLADGRSRFYAEIERLAALLRIAEDQKPLLFLVDEIFHGTNSAARSTGARKLIETLLGHPAIGIITTHDLALAHAVDALNPRVRNIHLRDNVKDGELFFDYKVHRGILEEGNAIHLMRSVGLPI